MGFEWWCGLLLGLLFGWLSHALLDWFLGLRGAHNRFQGSLSDAESERDRLRVDLGGVQRQLADRQGADASLEREVTELRARLGEFDANVAELAGLRLKLAGFDGLSARVPSLETELSEATRKVGDLEAQLETSDTERSSLKSRLGGLEHELGDLRASREHELADLRKRAHDAEAAQARLPELETLVASMQAKLGDAQGLAARFETREAELLSLQTRLSNAEAAEARSHELERQLIDLRNRFESVEGERDWVKQELSVREADLFELAGKLNAAEGFRARAMQLEADLMARNREPAKLESASVHSAELEKKLEDVQRKLSDAESSISRLGVLESQHVALRQQIAELTLFRDRAVGLEHELEKLRADLIEARKVPDDLTRVDGIGAVFAKRLNLAGITRFSQLAQTPPDALHEIIKPEDWQKIEFEHWTEDAAILATGQTPPKRAKQNERLSRITGIGEVYEKRLREAGITTYAQLVETDVDRLTQITGDAPRAEVELWITEADAYAHGKRPSREREKVVRGRLSDAEDELERLRGELRRAESQRRDRFEVMTQIGDAKQRRLYGAGIYLFEDLAQTPEARLREVFENEDLDYPLVIREATEYARGEVIVVKGRRADRFERLTGVSETDARALLEAGVFTFEDLAQLSSQRLREIIGRDALDGWITEAGAFAKGEAQIEFVDAGKRDRDQLWRIDGIGEVFEVRLNKAGLFSFTDVAASDRERLLEILGLEPSERIEPQAWIAQARELAAREVSE
jgi:predicted flap endonuclease-1-like 5' DNA nuclease/predicted  nucleic acid-binding Zn-ribbon protein